MKSLKCDLCDHVGQGENFEGWMEALKPHYMEAHADFMKAEGENKSPEEQQAGMMKWVADNKARFEAEAAEA